jgi:4-hydroxymandelate synthase
MNILGIDHLELYVGDARQAAYLLCAAMGFRICGQGGPETGLPGQRSILLGQGDARILLTTGLTPNHPATEYVARHGDGVAVVGFGAEGIEPAFGSIVARGGTAIAPPTTFARGDTEVVTAMVSGFGDVAHRLVERRGSAAEFLPNAIDMITPDPEAGDDLLQLVDHLAVCLPAHALRPTVRYYEQVFGFKEIFEEYIEVGEQGMDSKVVQSPSGGITFTLIEPDVNRHRGQIDDFLDWHGGAGVQHIAFRTSDIVTAVRTFSRRGIGFAATPASYYDMLERRLGPVDFPVDSLRDTGILVDRDEWGQMFQIFTLSMHVRRTLFLELIERHGARTFGSSNIKALYEAKERELTGEVTEASRA